MLTSSLQKELVRLKEQLSSELDAVNMLLNEQSDGDAPETHEHRRSNMSKEVGDMAYQIILSHGRPMHRDMLVEELEDSGISIRPDAKRPKMLTSLSAILSKDARFKSQGRGTGLWGVDHDHVTRTEHMDDSAKENHHND